MLDGFLLKQISLIVLPLLFIGLAGFFYGRFRAPDMAVANRMNMDVFLPCLMFASLVGHDVALGDYLPLALGTAVVVIGSGLLAWPFARLTNTDTKTFIPPFMFNNCGNLGLPLALFAFGEPALVAAVVMLMIESGLHFSLGMYMLDRRIPVKQILTTPFIVACLVAVLCNFVGFSPPQEIMLTMKSLGQVSIPLMLFSLGVRMVGVTASDWRDGMLCAVLNPIIGIALAVLMVALLDLQGTQANLLLLFGILPPAVLNYLFAEWFRQEPRRVGAIVMVGNITSVVTIPLMLVFLLR